jgi:hypothetical protein
MVATIGSKGCALTYYIHTHIHTYVVKERYALQYVTKHWNTSLPACHETPPLALTYPF